jgi:uncharacterized membrane protein YciS (DUF1049 family)
MKTSYTITELIFALFVVGLIAGWGYIVVLMIRVMLKYLAS